MIKKLNTDFTLNSYLFGSVKLTKTADPDKYKCSGYDIEFDSCSEFLWCSDVIIFGADMCSPVHVDNKGKDILILVVGPT